MAPDKRPLSPHLQIYRPQITSALSILHRITGFILSIGVSFFVFWLSFLALGGETFSKIHCFLGTIVGNFALLALLFCFIYHFFNGLRHLYWDAGFGLELSSVYKSGWFVLLVSVIVTLLVWCFAGGI